MAPVSKTQFFEIIDRLVKIEDHILNFGFIESNMKVLKYLVKTQTNPQGCEYMRSIYWVSKDSKNPMYSC